MAIVYDEQSLDEYMRTAVDASPQKPILIDKFLERAVEIDVDALADESACIIAGIQEHIEEAGIHSGDSSSVLPAQKLPSEHLETIKHYTRILANSLSVKGLMNIQFAVKDDRVYVLEVNPRASRTVPFVAKATGSSDSKNCFARNGECQNFKGFYFARNSERCENLRQITCFPIQKIRGS
jgi:carbamoyl-phosphate synthase large subunit